MTTARQRMAMGGYGEAAAARHLTGLGMVVLDRNWRSRSGEIDLVLRDGQVLVFCEVKTRASAAYGSPCESVSATKLARLRRLAAEWMEERGLRCPEVRFDIVGICLSDPLDRRIEHVRGVG